MTDQNLKPESNSNSAFIFGLSLGAAVGAIAAILIHKNSDKEVIQNFESKVKDFFKDLISEVTKKNPEVIKKVSSIEEKVVDFVEDNIPVAKKKSTPKTFIKAKK